MLAGRYPRPCIAEMGGKNACIVTGGGRPRARGAGIVRSAFGMGGQKCSARRALYVDEGVADRARARTGACGGGDPDRRPDACARTGWVR